MTTGLNYTAAWQDRGGDIRTLQDIRDQYPSIMLPVKKVELAHNGVPFPGKYVIEREDGKPLGIVGRKYVPYQMPDVLDFADTILDTGEAEIAAAMPTMDEARFMVLFRVPKTISIGDSDDEIQLYMWVENSHDGSRKLRVIITPLRAWCLNMQSLVIRTAVRSYELSHTKSIEGRVMEARNALDIGYRYMDELESLGKELVAKPMRGSDFTAFLNRLVPLPEEEGPARTRRETVRESIRGIYASADNLANVRNTRWAALQAVIEHRDHHQTRRNTVVQSAADNRLSAIVEGDAITDRALALLT